MGRTLSKTKKFKRWKSSRKWIIPGRHAHSLTIPSKCLAGYKRGSQLNRIIPLRVTTSLTPTAIFRVDFQKMSSNLSLIFLLLSVLIAVLQTVQAVPVTNEMPSPTPTSTSSQPPSSNTSEVERLKKMVTGFRVLKNAVVRTKHTSLLSMLSLHYRHYRQKMLFLLFI